MFLNVTRKGDSMSDKQWKPDSRPRNKGFSDYEPDRCHQDKNPYNFGTWQWNSYREGWNSAHGKYVKRREENIRISEEHRLNAEEWDSISSGCPWLTEIETCVSSGGDCTRDGCAVNYFFNLKG